MNDFAPVEVKVWGDFACFTRPDMKAERVSYPVMTPSSARGILESIFWKPEFNWRIFEIEILKPIKHFSILRNEVNNKAAIRTIQTWQESGERFFADDNRAQRHSLILRDVEYIIKADVALKSGIHENPAKYRDQFRRRVKRGQCFRMPYLGCREFTAFFGEPDGTEKPEEYTSDLGLMLFDLRYEPDRSTIVPIFFRGRINNGIFRIPQELYTKREATV